jgi:hypothetical protein
VQAIHFISAAAEFQLCSDLWVLINPDNVPVNENPLLLLRRLHKLRQKTANYQAQDRSALHYKPLRAAPVLCSVQEYHAEEPPISSLLKSTQFSHAHYHLKIVVLITYYLV